MQHKPRPGGVTRTGRHVVRPGHPRAPNYARAQPIPPDAIREIGRGFRGDGSPAKGCAIGWIISAAIGMAVGAVLYYIITHH